MITGPTHNADSTVPAADKTAEGRDIERLMDAEEAALADRLKALTREHRQAFKERVRGKKGQAFERASDLLRDRLLPKYRKAVQEAARKIRRKARILTLRHNGWLRDLVGDTFREDVTENAQFEESLTIIVNKLADELFQRQNGLLKDDEAENVRQETADGERQREKVIGLKPSTVEKTANKIGSASVSEGRDDVAKEASDASDTTIYAVRTAELDARTCGECEKLHGTRVEYGSSRYSLLTPPARCEGRERCRCYWRLQKGREGGQGSAGDAGDDDNPYSQGNVPDNILNFAEGDQLRKGRWEQLFPWGHVKHPNGDFTVDRTFFRKMRQSFEFATQRGYYPPLLEEHESEGRNFGYLVDLGAREDGIYGLPVYPPKVREQVEQGERRHWSPSFYEHFEWPHGEEERVLENHLREVSFVGVPHLKQLKPLGPADAAQPIAASEDADAHSPLIKMTEAIMADDETPEGGEPTESMDDETRENMDAGQVLGEMRELIQDTHEMMISVKEMVEREMGGRDNGEPTENDEVEDMIVARIDEMVDGDEEAERADVIGQLAQNTGMSAENINAFLRGDTQCPPLGRIEAMAEVLQVDTSDIVDQLGASRGCDYSEAAENRERIGELEGTLRELREKLTRQEIQEAAPHAEDGYVDRLVSLRASDEETYRETVTMLAETGGRQPPTSLEEPADEEIGATGSAPTEMGDQRARNERIFDAVEEDGYRRGSSEFFREAKRRGATGF